MPNVKTALVTGAAKRIGRELAIGLANAGYNVAIHYNKSAEDALETQRICQLSGAAKTCVVKADLDHETQRTGLISAVCDLLAVEHLDLLINCASHFEYDNAQSCTANHLTRHLASNFLAPVELTLAMVRLCSEKAQKGHVITFLDQKVENLNIDYVSYTLTKLASYSSIRFLAQVGAPFVRVNAISPGLTLVSGAMTESEFNSAKNIAALGQSNCSADLLEAVLYLDRANSVTGQNIIVDGGQHLVPRVRDVAFQEVV